jgi:hypothetical protein
MSAKTRSKNLLKVPASTPRNPIATNPLLKKSGAHKDKRAQVREREDVLAIKTTDVGRGRRKLANDLESE